MQVIWLSNLRLSISRTNKRAGQTEAQHGRLVHHTVPQEGTRRTHSVHLWVFSRPSTAHRHVSAAGVAPHGPTASAVSIPDGYAADGSHGAQTGEPPPPCIKAKGRRPHIRPTDESLVQALVSRVQLPHTLAVKLLAARAYTPHVSSDPDKLCQRVQHLQQLLGPVHARRALERFPSIVAYSPQRVAFNYKQWQLFFGTHETSLVSSTVARQLQQTRQQGLLRAVCNNPQLLCCAVVEQQVGNLYEIGALIGAQDLHAFAYRAMDLALMGPNVLQDKFLRVLAVLNSEPWQPPQQQLQSQQQSQVPQGRGRTAAQSAGSGAGSVEAGTTAGAAVGQVFAAAFSLSDLQAAARRDQQWLSLSADTLEQRLQGLRQELGVPMCQVGVMFLANPSLLNKKPTTVVSKLTALQSLPGITPTQACAAVAAMPSLLNLKPDRLASRWQQLQQAADTHPAWRAQLDCMPPSSLAGLLIRSDVRYQRLQSIMKLRLQDRAPLSTTLNATDSYFSARLDKIIEQACRHKPRS